MSDPSPNLRTHAWAGRVGGGPADAAGAIPRGVSLGLSFGRHGIPQNFLKISCYVDNHSRDMGPGK